MAVGVHAVRKANVRLGDSVAVLGAGPIGLSLLLAARASGAAKVLVTDAVDYNLSIARRLGCTHAIHPGRENAVECVQKETGGEGADVVFVAVGVEAVLNDALRMVRRGGRVPEVALFEGRPPTQVSYVQSKEINLGGSNMYTRCDFTIAAEAIALKQFDTSLIISKVVPIEQAREAIELVDKKKENVVKVLLSY